MNTVLTLVVTWVQPVTAIAFVITGVCLLLMQNWQYGIMNVILALFNFITFYGGRIWK